MSIKEERTRRQKQLYLERVVILSDNENDVIQEKRPVVQGQRSSFTRKMFQKRLKKLSKKLTSLSSIRTLAFI